MAALATLAVVIAACGTGVATTAPVTQAPATQAPTAAATQGAAATGGPSLDPLASFHGAQDLEALLPDELDGQQVTKASASGTDFMALGASEELKAALTALNKTPADLQVAFASAGSLEASVTVFAFQVNGVPGGQILSAMFAAQEAGATISDASLGGKAVKKVIASGETTPSYIYTAQDVVFVVVGTDVSDALLNELFSKLP
jgi:hypothetical protein